MKPAITKSQTQTLLSMNRYWEEISQRENYSDMAAPELNQMLSVINPMQVLLIVGEYAKSFKFRMDTQ